MAQRELLIDEFGDNLRDIGNLDSKDITNFADGFGCHTVINLGLHFGMQRTGRLKALNH